MEKTDVKDRNGKPIEKDMSVRCLNRSIRPAQGTVTAILGSSIQFQNADGTEMAIVRPTELEVIEL